MTDDRLNVLIALFLVGAVIGGYLIGEYIKNRRK